VASPASNARATIRRAIGPVRSIENIYPPAATVELDRPEMGPARQTHSGRLRLLESLSSPTQAAHATSGLFKHRLPDRLLSVAFRAIFRVKGDYSGVPVIVNSLRRVRPEILPASKLIQRGYGFRAVRHLRPRPLFGEIPSDRLKPGLHTPCPSFVREICELATVGIAVTDEIGLVAPGRLLTLRG
jgi:hypothetical protein